MHYFVGSIWTYYKNININGVHINGDHHDHDGDVDYDSDVDYGDDHDDCDDNRNETEMIMMACSTYSSNFVSIQFQRPQIRTTIKTINRCQLIFAQIQLFKWSNVLTIYILDTIILKKMLWCQNHKMCTCMLYQCLIDLLTQYQCLFYVYWCTAHLRLCPCLCQPSKKVKIEVGRKMST